MRTGFTKNAIASPVAFLLPILILVPGCWIPLPEETAIVVEVVDAQGGPVDGVELLLDEIGIRGEASACLMAHKLWARIVRIPPINS